MKKTSRILALLLTLCLLLGSVPLNADLFTVRAASEQGMEQRGQAYETLYLNNLTLYFDGDCTVTVSGSGPLEPDDENGRSVWSLTHDVWDIPFSPDMYRIVLEEGVTAVRDWIDDFAEVVLPMSLTEIGVGCIRSDASVFYAGDEEAWAQISFDPQDSWFAMHYNATDHTPDSISTEAGEDATVITDGYYYKVYTCTVCDREIRRRVAIPAENPVIELVATKDVNVYQGINSHKATESVFDDLGQEVEKEYDCYDVGNDMLNLRLTLQNGTVFSGSFYGIRDDLVDAFGEDSAFDSTEFPTKQDYSHRWTAGNTYNVVFKWLGRRVPISVNVLENPVASLEVLGSLNAFDSWEEYYDPETGEYTENPYVCYNVDPYNLPLKAVFRDGREVVGDYNNLLNALREFYGFSGDFSMNIHTNQSAGHPWQVGQTYECQLDCLGFQVPFTVNVVGRFSYESKEDGLHIGDHLILTYDGDRTFTLSGTGALAPADDASAVKSVSDYIRDHLQVWSDDLRLVVEDGVTGLNSSLNVFSEIVVPESVTDIMGADFNYDAGIFYAGSAEDWNRVTGKNQDNNWAVHFNATDHTPDSAGISTEAGEDATVITDGYYYEVYTCTVCGREIRRRVAIPAENPVTGIEVTNAVNVYEGLDTYLRTEYLYDKELDQDYPVSYGYFKISADQLNVRLKLQDGTVYSGTVQQIQTELEDLYGYASQVFNLSLCLDQSYENQWTVGNSYLAEFEWFGIRAPFTVNVLENPVASLEVLGSVNVFESYETDYDPETGEDSEYIFDYYEVSSDALSMKVVFRDGRTVVGNYSDLLNVLRESYGFSGDFSMNIHTNQSADHPWQVGQTYECQLDCLGFQVPFTVNVVGRVLYENEEDGLHIGDNLILTYDGDRTFTLSGTGALAPADDDSEIDSVYDYAENILQVWAKDLRLVVGDGITALNSNLGLFTEIVLPESITNVYRTYFKYDASIFYAGDEAAWDNIAGKAQDNEWAVHFNATDHTPDSTGISTEAGEDATAITNGYYYEVYTCSVCGREIQKQVKIPATNPVVSIIATAPLQIYQGLNSYSDTYTEYDDETGDPLSCINYERYHVPYEDVQLTVTMQDGTVYTGSHWEITEAFYSDFGYNVDIPSLGASFVQSPTDPWRVGQTYDATLTWFGIRIPFQINVLPNPIVSLTIDDIVLFEGLNAEERSEGDVDPETHQEILVTYGYYEIRWDSLKLSVTLEDGTQWTDSVWGVRSKLAQEFGDLSSDGPDLNTYQTLETPWNVGKHPVDFEWLGIKGTFTADVRANPIDSIRVSGVDALDLYYGIHYMGSTDWTQEPDPETPEVRHQYPISLYDLAFEVALSDGSVLEGDYYWIINGLCEKFGDIGYPEPVLQMPEGPDSEVWSIGRHTVRVVWFGRETEIPVNVHENPVSRVEAEMTRDLIEAVDSFYEYDNLYSYENDVRFHVTLNSGEVLTGNWRTIYPKMRALYGYHSTSPAYTDDQTRGEPNGGWNVGEHRVQVSLYGHTAEFLVNVAENPVESVTARQMMSFIKGVDNRKGGYPLYEAMEFTLTFKDGRTFTGTIQELRQYLSYRLTIEIDGGDSDWQAGTHTAYLQYGKRFPFQVKLIDSTVRKIEVSDVKPVDAKTDGRMYDTGWGYREGAISFSFTVTYADNTQKTFLFHHCGIYDGHTLTCGTYSFPYKYFQLSKDHKLNFSYMGTNFEVEIPVVNEGTFETVEQNGALYITAYYGGDSTLTIPAQIEGLSVAGVADLSLGSSLSALYSVRELIVEDGVRTLAPEVFRRLPNLQKVTFGKDVAGLTAAHFAACRSLKTFAVSAENPLYTAKDGVLYNKDVSVLVAYPQGVANAQNSVYTVPDTVSDIDAYLNSTFSGAFSIGEGNPFFTKEDGVLYDKDRTKVLRCDPDVSGDVVLPQTVTNIATAAFANCQEIDSVTIPDTVTEIVYYTFAHCGAKQINLPTSVKSIGENAFSFSRVEQINLSSVETIADNAFVCAYWLSEADLSAAKSIGAYAFDGSGLTAVRFGNALTTVSQHAFQGNNLTELSLPASLQTVGDNAFNRNLSLRSLTLSEGMTAIGESAFANCGITSLTLPNSMQTIGESAFAGCQQLTEVNFGSGLKEIPFCAFQNCDALKSVTIPATVKVVREAAFNNSGVEEAVLESENTVLEDFAFIDCPVQIVRVGDTEVDVTLRIFGSSASYDRSTHKIVYPDGVTEIVYRELSNGDYNEWTIDSLPTSVRHIDQRAFEGVRLEEYNGASYIADALIRSTALQSFSPIVVRPGTRIIADCAFKKAVSDSVELPEGLQIIGNSAFANSFIQNVTLPASLQAVGSRAFENTRLSSVHIPALLTEIGDFAFANTKISEITVDAANPAYTAVDGVLYTKDMSTLVCCPAEKTGELRVPASVTCIRPGAFVGCDRLTSVTLGADVTELYGVIFGKVTRDSEFDNYCDNIPCPTIYVVKGSVAEEYARSNCLPFQYKDGTQCDHSDLDSYPAAAATCVTPGHSAYTECRQCHQQFGYTVIPINPENHAGPIETIPAVAATCVSAGHTEGKRCAACKVETVKPQVTPTVAHTWDGGKITATPTCKDAGVKTYTCSVCKITKTESIPKTNDHVWDGGKITKEATATEDGIRTYTCSVCKTTKTESVKPTTVTDPSSGVSVSYGDATYSGSITVKVVSIETPDALPAAYEKTYSVDISTYLNNKEVEPTKPVVVTVPVPSGFNPNTLAVYHIKDDGTVEKVNFTVKDGKISFTAFAFSIYVVTDTSTEVKEPAYMLGDVDDDGSITAADARLALRRAVQLETFEADSAKYLAADVDKDGAVTASDARLILRKAVSLDVSKEGWGGKK